MQRRYLAIGSNILGDRFTILDLASLLSPAYLLSSMSRLVLFETICELSDLEDPRRRASFVGELISAWYIVICSIHGRSEHQTHKQVLSVAIEKKLLGKRHGGPTDK